MSAKVVINGVVAIAVGIGCLWSCKVQTRRALSEGKFWGVGATQFTLDREADKQTFWMTLIGRAVLMGVFGAGAIFVGVILTVAGFMGIK